MSSKSQLDVMSSKSQSSISQLDGRSNKSQSSSNGQLDGMPEKCHSMSAENDGDGDVQSELRRQTSQSRKSTHLTNNKHFMLISIRKPQSNAKVKLRVNVVFV